MRTILIISFILLVNKSYAQEECRISDDKNCMLESTNNTDKRESQNNIIGGTLKKCSTKPLTGFFRDGTCRSNIQDIGNHSVCSIVTKEFLVFTKNQGNDLSTPNSRYNFPGLKPGDKWCLCAARWLEAKKKGIEMKVDLEASSSRAFEVTSNFDYQWKYRVIKCSQTFYQDQAIELLKDLALVKELKLIAIPDKEIDDCKLIGLDGGTKAYQTKVFKLSQLKKIINSMPMRIKELESK